MSSSLIFSAITARSGVRAPHSPPVVQGFTAIQQGTLNKLMQAGAEQTPPLYKLIR